MTLTIAHAAALLNDRGLKLKLAQSVGSSFLTSPPWCVILADANNRTWDAAGRTLQDAFLAAIDSYDAALIENLEGTP